MTVLQIPLSNSSEAFSVSLGGAYYNLATRWNAQINYWTLDISDANNNPIVLGIPMVAGRNLLEPYQTLGFNFALYVMCDGTQNDPAFTTLGISDNLYYVGA